MICARCLRSTPSLRSSSSPITSFPRQFTTTRPQYDPSTTTSPRTGGTPAATSTSAAQPFSTPLSPTPNPVSLRTSLKPKAKFVIPESSCPAGTALKGLNYLKGRDDPVALKEEEYPEWLWRCLDAKKGEEGEGAEAGDEFSKSKKSRRLAAKRQRKLEEQLVASGNTEALAPKIPITAQSIDLPANKEGSVKGALEAEGQRGEVRKAMRVQRRKDIKERNFLGSM